MKFFAQSAFQHIRNQIQEAQTSRQSGDKLLFMMPSLPAPEVDEIGAELEALCTQNDSLTSLIKVAKGLAEEWENDTAPEVHASVSRMSEKGWFDERGNLTSYRNQPVDGASLVVLLVGVDRVTDASSLADFHHCKLETVWRQELEESFATWIEQLFEDRSIAYEDENVSHFDEVLKALVERGLADVLQIGEFLQGMDLSGVQDGKAAERVLLESLTAFGLPPFLEYRFSSKKSFATYLDSAVDFFSYDAFLEKRSRDNAVKAIDKLREEKEVGELFDPDDWEPYESENEFVEGIRSYILTNDSDEREKLQRCDYVTIQDEVVRFKGRKKARKTARRKKLSGGPIEVVLTALWGTLAEFKKEAVEKGLFAHEALSKICIKGTKYKHDSDGATAAERAERGRAYLKPLVGGVDDFIEKNLEPEIICGDDIPLRCSLYQEEIQCASSRTASPSLEFTVSLFGEGLDHTVSRDFAWRLPEIQPYRIADELFRWAGRELTSEDYVLPVFHVPYYEELMLATDNEEVRRVLLQCIQEEDENLFNLIGEPVLNDLQGPDSLLPHLQKLAYVYREFIRSASETGLHSALANKWDDLRKAYVEANDAYLKDPNCKHSPLAISLFRGFLILQSRKGLDSSWVWEGYEPSGVVTVLHPALLEMLQAHVLYLLTSFNSVASKELRSSGKSSFRDMTWKHYVDLSAVQMPLTGLLKDANKILDTNVRGENLIHRIGRADSSEASLTTRLLLRYDDFEEEDLSDTELFRESRESKLVSRILTDYRKLHPHANDGLSIAVYQKQDIQPVIAAVNQFLKQTTNDLTLSADGRKYSLSITVFTESNDDTSVARWIEEWRERWETEEASKKLAHYGVTHLSVAHRIISKEKDYEQFRDVIKDGLEVDVAILNGFIGAGTEGNDFRAAEPYDVLARSLKFPILQKSSCSVASPGMRLKRARILSNRQFRIPTKHAETMARLKVPSDSHNDHIVLGFGDYKPWQGVVDALHQRAEWIVCIDPYIDEQLIENSEGGSSQRDIIGFGSGVGSHGEANYTISTEQFHLSDVRHRLKASINELYSSWTDEEYSSIADCVVNEASQLSGLSLVRATGIGEYVRDFMAYSLTRKMLKKDEGAVCDQIISLDAYRHWFEPARTDMRPDLLRIVANLEDGRIKLNLSLIECKLAQTSDLHLEKARQQLEEGLRHLIHVFMPFRKHSRREDDRPDQRYWWLQLHRLIASRTQIAPNRGQEVLAALERLSGGDFDVEWQAAAISFWTDQPSAEFTFEDHPWILNVEGKELDIDVMSAGKEAVKRLCSGHPDVQVEWPGRGINFEAEVTVPRDEQEEEESRLDQETGGTGQEQKGVEKEPEKDAQPESPAEPLRHIPERILLGKTPKGTRKVFWEFGHPQLNNRHMLMFGTSGMGKTYTIECLLYELGLAGQNALIVDYTNGFYESQLEDEFIEELHPVQHVVRKAPLYINPFRRQTENIGDMEIAEGPSNTAQRVTGVFGEVYNFGDQQKSALYRAVKESLEQSKDDGMVLEDLVPALETLSEDRGPTASAAATVLSKIRPFLDQNPFGREDPRAWDRVFGDSDHRCHILQLAGFLRDASRLITEFSLIDLYWYYRGRGSKDEPKVVVLDEVQNLDHREESPLAQLLREGRKFGFSLILATQIMSNLNRDERDRLFNAAHKLFFRPADTEIRTYADIAAVTTGETVDVWMKRLSALGKAECYSIGPSLNVKTGELETKAFRIHVTGLAERGRNDKTANDRKAAIKKFP